MARPAFKNLTELFWEAGQNIKAKTKALERTRFKLDGAHEHLKACQVVSMVGRSQKCVGLVPFQ
jgi:hypothetical protein